VATTEVERTGLRDLLSASVNWPPARNTIKRAAYAAAYGRGQVLSARRKLPAIANVYAASCPKSGSQWIKALVDHPVVRAHTGLFTLPQLDDFNTTQRTRAYPAASFIPGLYVSYQAYQLLAKPYPHRLVYIFRDPRDIVVSGYFSGLATHREYGTVAEHRAKLRAMSTSDGLLYALDYGQEHVRNMATWVDVDDPNVATWRLEDISADPATAVPAILQHIGVELSGAEMQTVLAETSREALQRKDLAHRKPGEESHYRKQRAGFRDLFGPEHYEAVERVVPGLVEKLGYPAA
jgi:hypothetical protein